MESIDASEPSQAALAAGLAQHRNGDLAAAAAYYRRALEAAPDHPYALNLLGLIEYQSGRHELAGVLAERAIARYPAEGRFHVNLANIRKAEGRLDAAEAGYRAAISRNPSLAEAHNGLGILLRERRRFDEAIEALRSGLAVAGEGRLELALNLGVVLTDAGRHGEAIQVLQEFVRARPADHEAHYNLGNALAAAGAFSGAADAFGEAVALRPSFVQAWYNLGNAHAARGKLHDAADAYRAAVGLDPKLVPAWINLGNAESRLNHAAEAAKAYGRALDLSPENVRALCGRGRALLDRNEDLAGAARDYERAIALDPACAHAYLGMGSVNEKAGQLVESVICLDRAIAFEPGLAEAHLAKGGSLWALGRMGEAIVAYDRAAELAPESLPAASNSAFGRTYHAGFGPQEVLEVHRAYARRVAPKSLAPARVPAGQRERLRIGYVSADFRRHSVSNFFGPALERHDRSQFEIWCYFNNRKADDVTARFLALADGWVDCADFSDDELERRIRADGIDILVDLSGHTSGNRLAVFARKPAPLQGTWLGYPTTTGLDTIDFRVTDWRVDPEGDEAGSVERPLRLPHSYFCFGEPAASAEVGPPPLSREPARPVFGSFNNLAKLSTEVLELWRRVLDAVNGSRLMLKSRALADEKVRDDLAARLEASGIARDKLILSGWKESTQAHLAAYRDVDVALDTWPYNGATTTCEALWMGVPVVTLSGRTHASRMGASILGAAGLESWITGSQDEYVRIAAELASDADTLARQRAELRQRLKASPLMDAPRFASELEAAYTAIWRERVAS